MTLPCQRTSSGSVKLPVQAAPLWAAAGPTPAEAASNPRATTTKIRVRFVFMLKFLPKPDFPLILYALSLVDTRSGEHLTGREGGDALTICVCRWKRLKGREDSVEFGRTERTSDFSTSERILSGRITGLSVRIVFHEIRGERSALSLCVFLQRPAQIQVAYEPVQVVRVQAQEFGSFGEASSG